MQDFKEINHMEDGDFRLHPLLLGKVIPQKDSYVWFREPTKLTLINFAFSVIFKEDITKIKLEDGSIGIPNPFFIVGAPGVLDQITYNNLNRPNYCQMGNQSLLFDEKNNSIKISGNYGFITFNVRYPVTSNSNIIEFYLREVENLPLDKELRFGVQLMAATVPWVK